MNFQDGDVVIVSTAQAGTLVQGGKNIWVLLANGDVFVGSPHEARYPQDQADLDACPRDVQRLEAKKFVRPDMED